VEAEAVGDLHPLQPRRVGGALRQHSEPRGLVLVVHHGGAAEQHLLELEDDLLVRDDGVVLGDGEVVHHGGRVDGDLHVGGLAAVGGEVEVLEERLGDDIVAEREELAGGRVQLRVRDHGGVELAAEVVAAHGLEVAVGGDAHVVGEVVLGHGEEAVVMVHQAGVGDPDPPRRVEQAAEGARTEQEEARHARVAVELADGLGEDGPPDGALLPEARRLGEAARVRLGAPGAEPHGVEHAVAVEEVVPRARRVERVRAVADVHAVEARRDAAGHREVAGGRALPDGRVVAGDLDGRVGGARERVRALQEARHEPLLHRVERRRGETLERVPLGHGAHWARGDRGLGLAGGQVELGRLLGPRLRRRRSGRSSRWSWNRDGGRHCRGELINSQEMRIVGGS